ncbi:MAG: hypothetical protein ACHQO8_07865 [Vicinamibacterales bacterium]
MSSETSTERRPDASPAAGFQPAHFYLIASMIAATAAVMVSRNTHPVALLLLSGTVLSAGLVGFMLHKSVAGFFGLDGAGAPPPGERAVEALEREKALVLRSIKELEFDHAMGKVSAKDFQDLGGRLRARALALMQDLERATKPASPAAKGRATVKPACRACGTVNERDARFCKQCGAKL